MLTIFTVWFWAETVKTFPWISEAPYLPLTAASLLVYMLGGAISSFLVLDRIDSFDLMVGVKVGVITSIASALYFSLIAGPDPNLIMALIISFIIGGYLGAKLRIWSATRRSAGEEPKPGE